MQIPPRLPGYNLLKSLIIKDLHLFVASFILFWEKLVLVTLSSDEAQVHDTCILRRKRPFH